jgi:hypothetical protein
MANELTVVSQLHYEKNTVIDESPSDAYRETTVDVTGNGYHHGIQLVATGATQDIVVGSVTLVGALLMLRNLNATNFVQVELYAGIGVTVLVLNPGDPPSLFRLDANITAIKMTADTAACLVDVTAVDA